MPNKLSRRKYQDDIELSIIGFGVITAIGMEQSDVDRLLADAVEAGVNYIDTGPKYGGGEGQEKLGRALSPYRDEMFVACKTNLRDAAGARDHLEESLRQLQTDHVDLFQFHCVTTDEDVQAILGSGGAAEAFLEARDKGKVRYIGLSAHSEGAAIAIMDQFPCDSILFPTNYVCFAQGNFGPRVLDHARRKGIARLALKAMAYTTWCEGEKRTFPKAWYRPISPENRALAAKALCFALSQDITAAIPPGDEGAFRLALELAAEFKPMSEQQQHALMDSARDLEPIFTAQ